MNEFYTPKPVRELNATEIEKFELTYYSGNIIKPSFELLGEVWATAVNKTTPTFRLYNCGTNYLKILKYTPENDQWNALTVEDFVNEDNIYSILWRMCCSSDDNKKKENML